MKCFSIFLGIAALNTAAFAAPLTYSSAAVTCTGFYDAGDETFPCANITDNIVDDSTGGPGAWSFWLGRQAAPFETITIDLGGLYTLDQIDLYNASNRQHNDRGTLDFRVWVSSAPVSPTDAPGDTFGTLVLDGTLTFYTGDPNPAQTFTSFLTSPTGRYVTFRADSFFSESAGLSELDLFGSPAGVGQVPEPATTALMAAGVLAIVAFRRRRA